MSEELRRFYEEGIKRIQHQNDWLTYLAANPDKALADDVSALVKRIRDLEQVANDLYLGGYCTCFAYGRMMRDREAKHPTPPEKE